MIKAWRGRATKVTAVVAYQSPPQDLSEGCGKTTVAATWGAWCSAKERGQCGQNVNARISMARASLRATHRGSATQVQILIVSRFKCDEGAWCSA